MANGSYDFQFTLWDAASGSTQQPQPSPVTVTRTNVQVTNGLFTVLLDFGANSFPGADRYLEISVRTTGGGAFRLLSPRQQVTSTPYAMRGLNATAADNLSAACNACVQEANINSVAGSKVSGAIPVNGVPAGSLNYIQNTTSQQASSNFNISGNGTTGGTLSANTVNATTQYNLRGSRVMSNAGGSNMFVGASAGESNTTGEGNSFFGAEAGKSNTTGVANSFFGIESGDENTTAIGNSFFGNGADVPAVGRPLGDHNSFFENYGGHGINAGDGNAIFGAYAGWVSTMGDNNSFVGSGLGLAGTVGSGNSFFGSRGIQPGQLGIMGHNNSFFGSGVGVNFPLLGSNNTFIGAHSVNGAAGITNSTAIGANASVAQSNSLVLGRLNGGTA